MVNQKIKKNEEHPVEGVDIYPFAFYPEMIRWKIEKIKEIDDKNIKRSIIISLIIDCACLVEGMLNMINREVLLLIHFKYGSLEHRLTSELEQRVENGSFTEQIYIFETLTDNKILDIVNNELWKSIKSLFTFRNNLAHGNVITIWGIETQEGNKKVASGKYKKIYDYFIENKLIDPFGKDFENFFFSVKSSQYFFKSAMKFIWALSKNVPSNSKEQINVMTDFLFQKNKT